MDLWTNQASVLTWSFSNLNGHGLISRTGTTTGGLLVWDPFGQPVDPVTFAIGTAATDDTGQVAGNTQWHQGALKQAESAGSTAVIEMGARLYVPALGRFLQVDPIEGGGDNDCVWPPDPINKQDLTGERVVDDLQNYRSPKKSKSNKITTPQPGYWERIAISAEASRRAFWNNNQGRQWDALISTIAKQSKAGVALNVCYVGCFEIANDHAGIGIGPKASLDASVSAGLSFNGPTSRTTSITGNCSAAYWVGGYVEGSAYGADPSGVITAFSSGYGAMIGMGVGCSVMLNWYW